MLGSRVSVSLVVACVAGCAGCAALNTSGPTAAGPTAAASATAGAPVGTESLAQTTLVETYFVLIPDLADVAATERAAHACPMPPDVDLELKTLPTEQVAPLAFLASPDGVIERDRPEVARSRRVLHMMVTGSSTALEAIVRASAACVRSAAVAGHAWIVDFHTMQLFTLAEFDALRGNGFAVSSLSLVAVHPWPEKGSKQTMTLATSGLLTFGLPELTLHGVPKTDAEMISVLLAAAQTLIERGRLDRLGALEVDLQRLTQGPWPSHAKAVADEGGTGKVSFTATWIEPTERPRQIELQLPGGTTERARIVGTAYSPPKIYPRITPAAEAAAERARKAFAALAPRFEYGVPDGQMLLVKVLRPLAENSDESEWMWLPATSVTDGKVNFFVPKHIGPVEPFGAGQSLRVSVEQIFDYLLGTEEGATVISGGETDHFAETKPPARMRNKAAVAEDTARAAALYEKVCDGGDLTACYHLGFLYALGTGVVKDVARAAALFQQACDGGQAKGCSSAGSLYQHGTGVMQDVAKGVALYRKACDGGDSAGCFNLGIVYENGTGVTPDAGKAVALYRKACNGGHAGACSNLGTEYADGIGVVKDAAKAVALYHEGCDGGDLVGCFNLGAHYADGTGVAKDAAKAAVFYQKACDGGHLNGCSNLGALYMQGGSVENAAKAAALFQKACDGGKASGCVNLGLAYLRGSGVVKDAAKAAALFQKSCDAGGMHGCAKLGLLYTEGIGVAQDAAKAAALYQKACDGGEALGCEGVRNPPSTVR